jgi:hypothetical protein
MSKNDPSVETENAKYFENMILYLELFDLIDSPEVNALRFKRCMPLMPSQLQKAEEGGVEAVGRRAYERKKGDAFDPLMENIALLNATMIFSGGDDEKAFIEIVAARELWGNDLQRSRQRINATLPTGCRPMRDDCRLAKLYCVPIHYDGSTGNIQISTHNYVRGRWWVTDMKMENDYERNTQTITGLSIAAAYQTSLKKSWAVEIHYARSNSSLCLLTDPTGIKEWFRLRDTSEGKSRRDSLLHWVSAHWRQQRIDPEVESYVRQHLRGKREFHWFGMDATIKIPESDEERIALLKHERRVMAIMRQDSRPRAGR